MSQLQVTGEAKIRDIQGPVVANSGVITALDGAANQYVRGDGTLASFPTSTGGGSSVSYYLNGSVNQGTFGGSTYYQMSKNAIVGTGTNFSTSVNGLLAQFITDANDPDVVSIPSGNWNVEFFMSVSASSGSLASFYVEIYKYDGSTFTLLATNVATPEQLTNTTNVDAYFTSVAMPLSAMAVTDRLAVRIYANVASKTVTLYTEDNRLCQIVTTFSKGMLSLNNLTDQSQYLTVGTSGTDFNIVSSGDTHTFNIPSASASNRGLITTGSQTIAGTKTFNNAINAESGLLLKNGFTTYSNSYTSLGGNIGNLIISGSISSTPFDNELAFTPSTSNTFTFPNASGTLVLLSADQTFTGINSFDYGINYKTGASLANVSGYISQAYAKSGTGAGSTLSLKISDGNSVKAINLDFVGSPATYTYTFPAASGTISLLESTQTFSGVNTFSGTSLILAPSSGDAGILNIKRGAFAGGINDYTSITSQADDLSIVSLTSSTNRSIKFDFSSITSGILRTYTLPNASGTLALLESNQTFTGLNTFSSVANMTATLQVQQGLLLNQGIQANALAPYTAISGYANGLFICPNSGTGYYLVFPTSSSYVYTFPAATGTLALTSNITSAISGTTNYHAKFTGTNTIGNSLIWDNGTNVGIGNTNTSYTLDVSGTGRYNGSATTMLSVISSATASGLELKNTGGTASDWIIQSDGGAVAGQAALRFYSITASAYRMSIDGSGNVGIGTSSPTPISTFTTLEIRGATGGGIKIGKTGFSQFNIQHDGTDAYFNNTANGSLYIYTNDTERMKITNAGNVGIGTSSPASYSLLDVNGQTVFRGNPIMAAGNGFKFNNYYNSGTGTDKALATGFAGQIYFDTSSGYIAFQNSSSSVSADANVTNTERMRILGGTYGKILFGNGLTTDFGAGHLCIQVDQTVENGIAMRNTSGANNGNYILFQNSGGGQTGTISQNGASGVIYGSGSDYRLKEDLQDFNGLDKVLAIKVYDYKWKDEDRRDYGTMAHELQLIIPSAVVGEKDGVYEDGSIKNQQVDYSKIVPVLVKAIQELSAQNQDLKSRLDKAGL